MRLLHINSNYLHSPLHSEMLNELEKQGVENSVIMPRKINDEKNLAKNIDSNIFHSQFLNSSDRLLYFKKQRKIGNWIEKQEMNFNEYDIVHAHTLFSDGYQAYKSDTPYVITVRNTDVNFYLKYFKHLYFIGRKILKKANFIIFLSESYKHKTINTLFNYDMDRKSMYNKSHTIPNGINQFWIDNIKSCKKEIKHELNFLFVGRIMKNKNLDFLAKNLKEDNFLRKVKIYVVGEIVDIKYYNQLKKFSNLIFLGHKNKRELKIIMEKMDVFTLISFHETFGLVYLEALTQNLPVLYTKNEGFDQYFKDGKVGYAISPKNGNELQYRMKEIIKNYDAFQNQILDIDKKSFSWNENAKRHKFIYQTILKKSKGLV
ncbi:glycosyltransferase family 4 protein [Staphylococcus equorum]|uniref:glycosyltransferase family 4 protein n=1 Tax=Staphylococcus equorum TaxID=246432 RepID=UPI002DB6E050|nr:glycosyltransferase family 4 protein [Staphylococcus equorum]MEB7786962.1 glycosyltransferase family 4 protein [Staphylococcus equorum]